MSSIMERIEIAKDDFILTDRRKLIEMCLRCKHSECIDCIRRNSEYAKDIRYELKKAKARAGQG